MFPSGPGSAPVTAAHSLVPGGQLAPRLHAAIGIGAIVDRLGRALRVHARRIAQAHGENAEHEKAKRSTRCGP